MQCPRCQQDNPVHPGFCLGCGALLVCGAGAAELPQEARFCLECRHALAGRPAAPALATAPKAYTPKYLAEKILTSKAALEGERKEATVRQSGPRLTGVTFGPFDDMRRWSIANPKEARR
jgi:hypothetical protein